MKCSHCSREISEAQSYVYQGKVYCDDCLMDIGLSTRECDPWATFADTRSQKLLRGSKSLNEAEKKIYDFVKSKGKATREEVMKQLKLSETDLKLQLVPLMHADLIKERSEGGTMYLIIPTGK